MALPQRDSLTGRFLAGPRSAGGLSDSDVRFVIRGELGGSALSGIDYEINANLRRIADELAKASFRNLNQAAAWISKQAKDSIERSTEPSTEGTPPKTRKGQLKRAIRYHVTPESGVVGPAYTIAGRSGTAHEFGGRYKNTLYPKRPFMAPALAKNLIRFGGSFSGSLGG